MKQETFIIVINVENMFCCLIVLWNVDILTFQRFWDKYEFKNIIYSKYLYPTRMHLID